MKLTFVPASHDHGWYFHDASGRVVIAQGQPVPLGVAQEFAASLASGWIPWGGGEIPPEAAGQRIDLEMRDGEIWLNQSADDCEWGHFAEDADIVLWRPTRCQKWSFDANGWHDIEAFQLANQRLAQHADGQAVVWPDESRADRDPTAVQGGVVAHPTGGCAPPVLTEKVRDWEPLLSAAYLALQLTTVAVGFITVLLAIGQGDVTGAAVMTALSLMWMSCAADTNAARLELVNG